jgi:hypothetical protein
MPLDLREYDPEWNRSGSVAGTAVCTWHGSENCSEIPRWSFRWRKTETVEPRESACDRGLEEAMLQGFIVGQQRPRDPVRP